LLLRSTRLSIVNFQPEMLPDHQKFEQALAVGERLRSATPRGRYAPSPSGPLHLGNTRTALLAWLHIRLAGGVFILRMEDLDLPRVKKGSVGQILDDLKWLGLYWDEGPDLGGPAGPYTQSQRHIFYSTALHCLTQQRRVFPCFCSRKDIRNAASAPHSEERGNIYPGTCRAYSPGQIQKRALLNPERMPAVRYRVEDKQIEFDDEVYGKYAQSLAKDVGDFVIHRAESFFAYHLAVVVDDALMGISDVLRGSDLLSSTPRQLELFGQLGLSTPSFWHVPLLMDDQGRRMSKRDGSQSIVELRERGMNSGQVIGNLAGSLDLVDKGLEMTPYELLKELDMEKFKNSLRSQLRNT